ncbi:T9SS type A sorting domain-containing protein [Halosquirtibacter laminarini]|uniref:T9SS type A sorting domain-containing protein n=1 Tax=Halosquirtibacter laminarini TaxID=3374600 RepID=A0AC61NH46_9BACT|nr:T9SS type A sorting domain-containing protein [Prolixibacteraceae bacterium]
MQRTFDLQNSYELKSFYVYDAGIKETADYNLQSLVIEVSDDNLTWKEVSKKTDINNDNIHSIILKDPVEAKYICFRMVGSIADDNVRIYEIEIYGKEVSTNVPIDISSELRLYPNPATDFISVDVVGLEPAQITIYNVMGAIVYQSNSYNEGDKIAVYHLTAGLYMLQMNVDSKKVIKKFIKY